MISLIKNIDFKLFNFHKITFMKKLFQKNIFYSSFIILTVLLIIFLINYRPNIIISYLSSKSGLVVKEVKLSGRINADLDEIINLMSVKNNSPITLVNIEKIKNRIETHGWIKHAFVRRNLPSEIHIRLVERTPFALWSLNNETVLISKDGSVITDKELENFKRYFLIIGENANIHVLELMQVIKSDIDLFSKVISATRIGDRRWNINFEKGVTVMLPEKNSLEAWKRLKVMHKKSKVLDREIISLDFRIKDRVIIKLENSLPIKKYNKGEPT
ncbi:FtsQ-type POTRA domain-containing protein [Alphaproteobacteria bacterium]|nr:FtsQ-type POTRA domain-containing protein [Alphaproteobacteria bacterium]